MKKIVLGTAGHIDHGKTTLIKKLTGTDCDRLKEEKERGITIELGFASLSLPSGQRVGIVDVPGHEKFIKNMVAGVGGIDGVIMVIAADEGVMPQTREHLDICRLLSVKHGIIALTKSDLVDEEWVELVSEDLKKTVKDTFLEESPIIPVSSTTGEGIDELLSAVETMVVDISERPSRGTSRLPIDRVFSMKGFGTVVTGTLFAGKLSVGNEVEIIPENIRTKIRGAQVHSEQVETVTAGQRTALNLQGIEKSSISRGNLICLPGTVTSTRRIDLWFHHLSSSPRPLKNRAIVRFHSGTSEILGRVTVLDRDELKPGDSAFVQLFLEKKTAVFPGDCYVIRSYSPVHTIGGGEIIDSLPLKHKRFSEETMKDLETLKQWDLKKTILLFCRQAGLKGLNYEHLQVRCGTDTKKLSSETEKMFSVGELVLYNKNPRQITLTAIIHELEKSVKKLLENHHKENPLKMGLLKEEIRTKLSKETNPKLYLFVIERLLKNNEIGLTEEFLALPGHKPRLKSDQQGLKSRLISLYKKGGITPPTKKELLEKLKKEEKEILSLLGILAREEVIVKLNDEIYYERTALKALTKKTVSLMREQGELTIKSFKDLTGLSRKFMIPFFEYLDKTKVTFRKEDKRVLRKPG